MVVTSRRRLLVVIAAIPVAVVAARLGDALREAAGVLRPPSSGTSATRCAACGDRDHAMLDPGCPATPRVRDGARA
jgi:hypothetical protein